MASLPSTLLWRWGVMNTNRPGRLRLWQRAPRHPGPHGNEYSSPIPTDPPPPRPNPSAAGQNLRKKVMALNLSHGSAQSQGGGWEWKQADGCGLPCA